MSRAMTPATSVIDGRKALTGCAAVSYNFPDTINGTPGTINSAWYISNSKIWFTSDLEKNIVELVSAQYGIVWKGSDSKKI
jgi:hypothetical protein